MLSVVSSNTRNSRNACSTIQKVQAAAQFSEFLEFLEGPKQIREWSTTGDKGWEEYVPMDLQRAGWDQLREQLELMEVMTALAGPGSTRGSRTWWSCPFHDERTPSFAIELGKAHYRCFGCGARGDAAALVMQLQGIGFAEAVRWLARFQGQGHTGLSSMPARSPYVSALRTNNSGSTVREISSVIVSQEAALAFVQGSQELLWTSKGAAALDYLRGRGLHDETILAARLGWSPRADFIPWRPVGTAIPWFEQGRLTLVKLRPDDAWLRSLKGRTEGRGPSKYLIPRRDVAPWMNPGLYMASPIRQGRPVVLCEGDLDALLVAQELADFEVGVVTRGSASGSITPRILSELLTATRWIVALDGDRAGDQTAETWKELAPGRCIRVRPPDKDWTEVHAGGPNRIRYWFGRHLRTVKWEELEQERWGPALLPEEHPDLDMDEPRNVQADT